MMGVHARWGMILVVASFCVLGAIHSVVVPLFEAPDEIWHFSLVHVLAAERTLPVQLIDSKDMWLREAGQPPLYYLSAAPIIVPIDTSDFPGFVRFNVAHPSVTAHSQSEAPNVFIHTPHESFPYRGAVLAVHVVRLLSVLWGAGTIMGAYLLTREIVPLRPGLAVATAAIVAFNPHFIFISSVVNNDACAACLCTICLWLTVRLGKAETTRKLDLVLGLVLGLALLSKMSALALLPLVSLGLWLAWQRDRDIRVLLTRGLMVFGLCALIASWWYLRNWFLYGDPLGWRVWLIDIGVHRLSLVELLRQFNRVAVSFWSPYDGLLPPPVLWTLGLLTTLATVGWVRLIVQRSPRAELNARGLVLTGTWFVLLFASLVRYMTTTPSAEGRLLFPGIAAASLILVLGWDAAIPRQWSTAAVTAIGAGLLLLSTASPLLAITARYALPLVASGEEMAGMTPFKDAVFGSVRLLGVEAKPNEAQAHETIRVTLYWEAHHAPPPANLRAVVRLWTTGGRLVGQWDTTPAGEVYPPDLWEKGDIVRDVYRLRRQDAGPAMCHVSVSVLKGDDLLGKVSSPAILKLAAIQTSSQEATQVLGYTLGDKIMLTGYRVPDSLPSPKEGLTVTLYWRALTTMNEDYTVFVHLLDENDVLRGQADGPPLRGDYLTSNWTPGEEVADVHIVPLDVALPTGSYLLVGLYRLADGMRLPAYAATGERVPHDAIRLDLNAVPLPPTGR